MRTFLALDIDDAMRKALAQVVPDRPVGGAKVRWVAPENLHVTLHFLGEVADERMAEVCDVVEAVAEAGEPFDFTVEGAVCIPPAGRKLRMVWANVTEPTGRLAELHAELGEALEGLGFHQERRAYRPHITLGRVKYARRPDAVRELVAAHGETRFGVSRADSVTAYGSELRRNGPTYTALSRFAIVG